MLFFCSKGLLASVRHGGKARLEAINRTLRNRIRLWRAGCFGELWDRLLKDHTTRTPAQKRVEDDQLLKEAKRVARLVEQGLHLRAASQLCSRGLAPQPPETVEKIERLFSHGSLPLKATGADAPTFEVEAPAVKKLIMATPKGLAPGASGLRAEHLKAMIGDRNLGRAARVLDDITKFVNTCLSGYLPEELQAFLCGGRLIPLNKKDEGIRPLVVGKVLRAIVAKLALKEVDGALQALQPAQIGVGGKGPVIQAAITAVKSWAAKLAPGEILLKVDIANAYNTISREACLEGVEKFCPDLLRWAKWCLNGSSHVYFGSHTIPCTTGVQQGDPLAPLLFAVGLHAIIERLQTLPGIKQMWFLDDGIIKGKGDAVLKAFTTIQSELAKIGLKVNLRKCEIYANGPESVPAFNRISFIANKDEWTYLGTPLMPQTKNAIKSAIARVKQYTDALTSFSRHFPQHTLELLQMTAGACKVEYLLQTLEHSNITEFLADSCSMDMKRVYAAILDVENFDEAKWIHATLPRRMGGLGLRDPTRVIYTARLASLTNTADLARQLGASDEYTESQTEAAVADYMAAVQTILRPELFPSKDLQKTLTQVLHDQALNRLINISDEPTKQKLNSLTTPHATAWTTISPLVKTLTPVESRAALRWVSGVPFRPRQYMCPHCGADADPYGLHAITCTRSGAISRGHNILRDTVAELFKMAGVPVDIEQTLPECFKRPADILV